MRNVTRLVLLVAFVALFTLPAMAAEHEVLVDNFVFIPADLTINVGDTVTWTNVEGLHNVNAPGKFRCANGCDDDGGNGDPASNLWTASRTFTEADFINYQCDVHLGFGMVGTLTVQDAGDFSLGISGSCPGPQTITLSGGTPNGNAVLLFSANTGSDPLPAGPCGPLQTGLANPSLLTFVSLDANGSRSLTPNAPAGACGLNIQTLDVSSCTLSNVATIAP